MGALGDHGGDLVEMHLHRVRADEREGQGGGDAPRRADRSEQVGVLVTLVGGLAWPRSSPRPLAHHAVLLADPSLVLEPDLDVPALGQVSDVGAQGLGEVFLNASMTLGS